MIFKSFYRKNKKLTKKVLLLFLCFCQIFWLFSRSFKWFRKTFCFWNIFFLQILRLKRIIISHLILKTIWAYPTNVYSRGRNINLWRLSSSSCKDEATGSSCLCNLIGLRRLGTILNLQNKIWILYIYCLLANMFGREMSIFDYRLLIRILSIRNSRSFIHGFVNYIFFYIDGLLNILFLIYLIHRLHFLLWWFKLFDHMKILLPRHDSLINQIIFLNLILRR